MPFLVKEKESKTSKIRKLTRKYTLPPFWPFFKFLKSTMEVVDILVRFPRMYYMLQKLQSYILKRQSIKKINKTYERGYILTTKFNI
jgi:cellulose synthase/poly-beta-1,6-N-acetylglucosamine synthase-like glycosyltransferase